MSKKASPRAVIKQGAEEIYGFGQLAALRLPRQQESYYLYFQLGARRDLPPDENTAYSQY